MSAFLRKMFDVGDLLVLTFGNCVLTTGVITWFFETTYVRVVTFFYVFLKSKTHDFLLLLSCCTRFLEH